MKAIPNKVLYIIFAHLCFRNIEKYELLRREVQFSKEWTHFGLHRYFQCNIQRAIMTADLSLSTNTSVKKVKSPRKSGKISQNSTYRIILDTTKD